jgi:hypothetical protein
MAPYRREGVYVSKSAHRGDGDASRLAPAPSPLALRTVRDVSPAANVTITDETPSLELTDDTSLLTLFEAILGVQAGRIGDRSAQRRVVDAQIRALRDELDLPEPVTPAVEPPANQVAASTTTEPGLQETADAVPPPHDGRRPTWRTLVTGLATRRKQYVGMAALAASAGRLW